MQRRTVLKLGLGAAAVLTVAGGAVTLVQPGLRHGRATASASQVLRAVARAVLDGSLPVDASRRDAALSAHLARMDDTLAALPPATQTDLSRLLGLLACAPGRLAFAGLASPWADAGVPELQSALQEMRTSRLALRQQAYHALRDLTNAAYFADPSTWSRMGYPGPRDL